jgi:ATP-dependent Zn protease
MTDDLLNILSNSNKDIDNQKLMDYVSGKLSAEEKYEFEKTLIDSEIMNDAVEGLEEFKNKEQLNLFVEQLNTNLKKQLDKRKTKKEKRKLKDTPWLTFTIVLVIIIILIAFFVIWKHLNQGL